MFYLFWHKIVVFMHFSYFNMASKMGDKGHVTIIIGSNSNRLNGSGDTLC